MCDVYIIVKPLSRLVLLSVKQTLAQIPLGPSLTSSTDKHDRVVRVGLIPQHAHFQLL